MNAAGKNLIKRNSILAIETGAGGRISIFSEIREVGCRQGKPEASPSEKVLDELDDLLKDCHLKKEQIEMIIVAKKDASSTGEKISLATAKGLAKALGCRLNEVEITEALLLEASEQSDGEYLTAAAAGKNRVLYQIFIKRKGLYTKKAVRVATVTAKEFFEHLQTDSSDYRQIILESEMQNFYTLPAWLQNAQNLVFSNKRLSELCLMKSSQVRLIMKSI